MLINLICVDSSLSSNLQIFFIKKLNEINSFEKNVQM